MRDIERYLIDADVLSVANKPVKKVCADPWQFRDCNRPETRWRTREQYQFWPRRKADA